MTTAVYRADFRWRGSLPSQRNRRSGSAVDGFAIEVLGGIRYFTGLFLGLSNSTVEFSARGGDV